ncbi:hypothetical protein SCAR479_11431 [Seiridium cardinale]|uniref:F-box domain-containing protein n=1 Tax=Seiridium cardinale TaxID=138064 RepID=A0ABR2XE16_9PEZI
MTLLTLPVELKLIIGNHLPLPDIVTLMTTCQHFQGIFLQEIYRDDVRHKNKALEWACEQGKLDTLQLCIRLGEADLNYEFEFLVGDIGSSVFTPLTVAIVSNKRNVVRALLQQGAHPDKPRGFKWDNIDEIIPEYWGPLYYALRLFGCRPFKGPDEDLVDLIQDLLEYGADPNSMNSEGDYPLPVATRPEVPANAMTILLDAGAVMSVEAETHPERDSRFPRNPWTLMNDTIKHYELHTVSVSTKISILLEHIPEACPIDEQAVDLLVTILKAPSPCSKVVLEYMLSRGLDANMRIPSEGALLDVLYRPFIEEVDTDSDEEEHCIDTDSAFDMGCPLTEVMDTESNEEGDYSASDMIQMLVDAGARLTPASQQDE